jgi:hypothetical protein
LYSWYIFHLCPTESNYGFQVLSTDLAGDPTKLNKFPPKNGTTRGYGYGFDPANASIVLRKGAPEISARDIVPKKYLFSYFINGA